MKKRLLSAILSFCMLLTMAPTVAFAADGDDEAAPQNNSVLEGSCGAAGSESNVTWKLTPNNEDNENPTYTLTISGSGAMADYTANINNAKATQPWRASATGVEIKKITNVVVSEDVTSIGAFAFNGLTGVSEYDIGANVSTIKRWALETSAAKVFNLNENTNFKTDDNGVLFNKDGTTLIAYPGDSTVRDEYTVPSAVTAISDGAFVGCPIKKLTIGNNVTTELPSWSFNGGELEELDVNCPFGSDTFAQITTLKKVTLRDSITKIPEKAFLNCTGLQTVSIPSGLTKIGSQAFFGCSSLQDVTLPASLTEIGYQAFRDCDALTSIIFPDSLTKIGESAFSGCTGLTYISYGNGIDDIGGNAFGGCTGVKVIDLHRATQIGELYNNGANNGDSALTHACIKDTQYVKYYLRTESQANSVKGNLEWGKGGAGKGNTTNTYYILTATDAVPDYTGQTETPKRAGYTFGKWEAVDDVSQGSTTTKNVFTDADSWSLASPAVTVSPASANTYVGGSAVTLTATVSEPVDGFTYSYQWYSNTSNSTEGGTKIFEATSATYSPNITAVGTTYYYCVVTVKNGSDTASATTAVVPVTVAKQAGSVTISNNKTAATYGDKPFTFTYTANKAATVTSSNTSVATVQDNNGTVTVTIVGAGTTEISVGFAGGTDYSAASDKFTLTVNKATPSIKISATPDTLTGGGSVELTVSGVPTEGQLAVTCDNDIKVTEKDGKYTAALPNETKDYTFKAAYTGTDLYNNASDTCVVSVTYKGSSHHSSSSSSSSTSNTVSASTASNGKVSLDKSTAKKGNTVTVTVTPDAGYQLDKLTVTDAKGKTVDVTDKGNGKYTFTMPEGKVTVTPTFSKIEDVKPSKNGFDDVASSDWFADAVKYVSDKGLMSGTGSDKFAPSATTTRAMLMTVLARYAGEDTTGGATWYEKGMEWAKAKGVSDGTNPNANITREQLVTMLYRYAGSPKADGKFDSFSDAASVSTYAADAMQWAVANGIVNGSDGKLNPQNNATRAEVAAILMRFCEMSK
ncbi:leucine-rich repeat protein [Agathobaculum sp. M2]|uniref:Leucine-rich repeat protein n=1 Tax=Agathobaculum hominis TaxID=2763014 RepID=A0ABR7GKH5_9FIRM|nr:leucine-rich repeat protein [Agathobaculum hominis]